jgi:hypothetical protein
MERLSRACMNPNACEHGSCGRIWLPQRGSVGAYSYTRVQVRGSVGAYSYTHVQILLFIFS